MAQEQVLSPVSARVSAAWRWPKSKKKYIETPLAPTCTKQNE
jgi:hypothetical protein